MKKSFPVYCLLLALMSCLVLTSCDSKKPNVKITIKENLSEDINGEAYEAKKMYPDFLKLPKLLIIKLLY
jgi:rubrerythrin